MTRSAFELQAERDAEAVERAIVAWGVALRGRYPTCGAGPLECGGTCRLIADHEPPCSCSRNHPDDCPA